MSAQNLVPEGKVSLIILLFHRIGYPRYALFSSRNSSMDISDIYKMSLRYACSPKLSTGSQDWLVITTYWRFQTNGFRPWHETCTQFFYFIFYYVNQIYFYKTSRPSDSNCWLTRNPYTRKTMVILLKWIRVGIDS